MGGTAFDEIFQIAGARYAVPAWLLEAVARTESNLNPAAIGDGGQSVGLFQMFEPTARRYGVTDMRNLLDPAYAADRAAAYIADIIRGQGGLVLENFYSEYNSGRALLWQTSTEVFAHVQRFLRNVDVADLEPAAVGAGAGLVFAAGLALWVFLRRKR